MLNKSIWFYLSRTTTAVIKVFLKTDMTKEHRHRSVLLKNICLTSLPSLAVNALYIRPDLLGTCFCWRQRSAPSTHARNELKRMSANQCKINLSYFTQGCLLGIKREKLNRSTLVKENTFYDMKLVNDSFWMIENVSKCSWSMFWDTTDLGVISSSWW